MLSALNMRILTLLLFFLIAQTPRTARDYYDELYAAGGLDRFAARYVCFDEDLALDTFFIYNKSSDIRDVLVAGEKFSKMPKDMQSRLNEDWIVIRGYDKGVPLGDEDYYDKNGPSWVGSKFKASNECCLRVRLTVTPTTMRYKRTVEILNPNGTMKQDVARYGRCEKVKPDITQTGK
jgi:hypothetical protein